MPQLTQRVGDQVQSPLILLNHLIAQTCEVEAVKNIVLVHFGKVFLLLSVLIEGPMEPPTLPFVERNQDIQLL